jgi:phage FluMu protein Com
MSEAWIKEYCPKCKTVNWIYIGSIDIDGVECRKCNEIFIPGDLSIEEYMKEFMFDDVKDMYFELGKERPE